MSKGLQTCLSLFAVVLLVQTSCNHDKSLAQYNQLVTSELASGKRTDSIFFGLYFGMTSKQFFMRCWELNKLGLLTDGENNSAVLYKLNHNEMKHPALMNFYPRFTENRINKMTVTFQYAAWAPWNKQLFADRLLPDVLNLFGKWYSNGNPFLEIRDEKKGTIYVKVDGNRRITIGKGDDMIVKVDYTDMLMEKQ